jgi:hypothetical protein
MDLIIDFFEWHGFSPSERFEKSLGQELFKNRKRTEAAIAIIKDIEKNQTKPTNAMLELLFQENPKEEEPQEEFFEQQELITENEELVFYREQYFKQIETHNKFKNVITELMDKLVYEKRNFGKDFFKLNATKKELEKFRNDINM